MTGGAFAWDLNPAPPAGLIPCPSDAAYVREIRAGQVPHPGCVAAHARAVARRKRGHLMLVAVCDDCADRHHRPRAEDLRPCDRPGCECWCNT